MKITNKTLRGFLALLLAGSLFTACSSEKTLTGISIEKRYHNKGYHISFTKKVKPQPSTVEKTETVQAITDEPVSTPQVETLVSNETIAVTTNASTTVTSAEETTTESSVAEQAVTTKAGKKVAKRIANKLAKNDVQFEANEQQTVKAADIKDTKKPTESKGGDRSQIVAALLAFFVGGLGIHRFYLGYTTIGIIQLLTFGGFGLWALIDFIRILTGDLEPKDGRYS